MDVKRGEQINKQKRSIQSDSDRTCERANETSKQKSGAKKHAKYKNKNRFGSGINFITNKFSNVKCVYKTVQ